MATIKGIWVFTEYVGMDGWAASADATKEYVNFTSYKSDAEPAYNYIGFNLQHYTSSSGTLDNLQYLTSTTTADRSYVWGKRSTDTYGLGWQYTQRRTVDFGETEQTVSDEFYAWFMKYATQPDAFPVYMDIDGLRLRVTAYMDIDGVRKKISTARLLVAPVLSLSGYMLTIIDKSDLATSFDILVDGEVKMEVPAKFSATEVTSGTSLTATINCCVGETIVAAIATRDTLTVSNGWTLISTSGINSADTTNGQRLSWVYKVAESTTESITVTQASAQRLYINMIALSKGASLVDNGYTYKNNTDGGTITVSKPSGLVLWGMTAPMWDSTRTPYEIWEASNGIHVVQLGSSTQSRLGIGYDSTDNTEVTFDANFNTTIIVGCLSVIGG